MRPEQEEEEESLLSCFAYISSSPHPPRPRPPRPTPVARTDPSDDDWPDSQLVQLSKCIVCRLRWTSSKSARQKRAHIKQCAKRNALAPDTVRFLIEKEAAPNENASTLMDSVVPAGPAKQLRRQHVVPTVRSLPETRETILDRARDILGSANTHAAPHPTQQFSRSALACQKSCHPKRPALLDVNGCMEEPSLTQPFGTSTLRGRIMSGGSVDRREGSCASMFAQGSTSILSSSDRKRPASPTLVDGDSRATRRRLQ